MDLRCPSGILFGITDDGHTLEVKCKSNRCGHQPGVVVLHRFNIVTGVATTLRFKDPANKE
jgi:hypothetical protein